MVNTTDRSVKVTATVFNNMDCARFDERNSQEVVQKHRDYWNQLKNSVSDTER